MYCAIIIYIYIYRKHCYNIVSRIYLHCAHALLRFYDQLFRLFSYSFSLYTNAVPCYSFVFFTAVVEDFYRYNVDGTLATLRNFQINLLSLRP
jgi:hypothetical protein